MSVTVETTGMKELIDRVEQMGLNFKNVSIDALTKAAVPVIEAAKQNIQTAVPHHLGSKNFSKDLIVKGKLIKSLKASKPKKGKYKGTYIRVFTRDPTAHLVEFGHGGQAPAPAHPFLEPALESNKAQVKEIMKNSLSEAINNG